MGMLRALAQAGIMPDIVAGSSVGSLNGAVVADRSLPAAVELLEEIWLTLTRRDIFPGGWLSQAWQLAKTRNSLFPHDPLTDLTCRFLTVTDFEDLRLPFGALATELISHHGTLFNAGPIRPALLASAAIPGIYPPVEINGTLYVDGALSAHVPLQAAFQMGAASLVVLDAGDNCHRQRAPRHLAEIFTSTLTAAMRQRVMVEAPAFAQRMPLLYLPAPCSITHGLLNFEHTAELMEQAYELTAMFLETAAIPKPGVMAGTPHFHHDDPLWHGGGQRVLLASTV